jgi:hypothetical protein
MWNDHPELRALALLLTYNCFRNNTDIEDLHSQGKITDAEMKALNIQIRNNIYTMIVAVREGLPPSPFLEPPDYWEEPVFDENLKKAIDMLRETKKE